MLHATTKALSSHFSEHQRKNKGREDQMTASKGGGSKQQDELLICLSCNIQEHPKCFLFFVHCTKITSQIY